MALDLVDLNVILYRADGEERDATSSKIGTYNIPGHGNLVYAGLEGWMALLRPIMHHNDLSHALCDHLRQGLWAQEYIHHRLMKCAFAHLASVNRLLISFRLGKQAFFRTSITPQSGLKNALTV